MKLCQENGLEEEDSEVALRDVLRCLGVPGDCGGAVVAVGVNAVNVDCGEWITT
jgi:hypothetical protein